MDTIGTDVRTLQNKIIELKKKQKAVLLCHNYQIPVIQDIADILGDSLGLAKACRNLSQQTIVLCGVNFMAETVKILSPEKKVLHPVPDAGCPLADMVDEENLLKLKALHPDAWVVSYVNTSARIKALSDVCCTSANALEVVKNVPQKKIIFTPDRNLGEWVRMNLPEKDIVLWDGYCIVHEYFSLEELEGVRRIHPDAEILVHPECRKELLERADHVLSTSGILKRARESPAEKIVVGTEEGIIHRLRKENPHKQFFSLGSGKICVNMKKIRLEDVYRSLEEQVYEVTLEEQLIDKAKQALERMVNYA